MQQERNPNVVIRDSEIHGKGIFAARRIRRERVIGVFEGVETSRDGMHVLWIAEDEGREVGIKVRNELRYINHSYTPNAAALGTELVALRNIQPGQEITMHYGEEWEE